MIYYVQYIIILTEFTFNHSARIKIVGVLNCPGCHLYIKHLSVIQFNAYVNCTLFYLSFYKIKSKT